MTVVEVFKCEMCGEEIKGNRWPEVAPDGVFGSYADGRCSSETFGTCLAHHCKDGNYGRAPFVGFRVEKAEDEEAGR